MPLYVCMDSNCKIFGCVDVATSPYVLYVCVDTESEAIMSIYLKFNYCNV